MHKTIIIQSKTNKKIKGEKNHNENYWGYLAHIPLNEPACT